MKTFVTSAFALSLIAVPVGAEDLTVLPDDLNGAPTKQMVSRYLKDFAAKAFERRRTEYEQRESPEQIAQYQQDMREFFVRQLGGFPERAPLKPQVVGKLEGDGFRVEKLIYESRPQHFVTAALYLPEAKPPYPAVLVPSGHSRNAKAAGYNQMGCMLLAKNGIAALCYDPIGQGERFQLLDADGKPRFGSTTEHTLVGAGSILVGRNTAAYRTWDGMRSIDYLVSRPVIDAKKIGCTGCSGGGTLTSYLMALDERIACASPSCYLTSFERLIATIGPQDAEQNIAAQIAAGMDHADYVMMRAPRPTLICAATSDFFDISGTWDGFREAKRLYTRMGFPERVALLESDTKHGYGTLHREGTVRWMRRWLLGVDDAITEPELTPFSDADLQCTEHGQVMLMPGARSVVDLNVDEQQRLAEKRKQFWKDTPRDEALQAVRKLAGVRPLNKLPRMDAQIRGLVERDGYQIAKIEVQLDSGIHLPALAFTSNKRNERSGQQYLYVHEKGKSAEAAPGGAIEQLVRKGHTVLAVDLRGIGETANGVSSQYGGNFKDIFLAYLLGKSFVGMWAEDVLAAAKCMEHTGGADKLGPVHLIAVGNVGPAALHAAALEADLFESVRLEGSISSWSHYVSHADAPGGLVNAVHGALGTYDLPDLVNAFGAERVEMVNPVD